MKAIKLIRFILLLISINIMILLMTSCVANKQSTNLRTAYPIPGKMVNYHVDKLQLVGDSLFIKYPHLKEYLPPSDKEYEEWLDNQ
tara:strand:+ start:11694 stop:11951 length:258 start_codon:yes stop_codon:yes gene_type:complete